MPSEYEGTVEYEYASEYGSEYEYEYEYKI
jgi:hypothetical protein